MKPITRKQCRIAVAIAAALAAPLAAADSLGEWNVKASELVATAGIGAPPSFRLMAIVATATYEAVNAITRRYPIGALRLDAPPGASADAAIAAAHRLVLTKVLPQQQAAIDAAYQAALVKVPDGADKVAGIVVGEKAAQATLDARADDGAAAVEAYRPHAAPGQYVPTAIPFTPHWPGRRPWILTSAAQLRPGPPPALTSELWARDYNEIKTLGVNSGSRRSAEQTEVARFWAYGLPPIYQGILRSFAGQPGRELTQNARLFAAASQAMDDALIAVFDAKYHYGFWRPITAIRNGDIDGNDATEREASWLPLIDTPMHPEYPCAHCILSASVGVVLKAEIGGGAMSTFATNSPSARGVARSWTRVDDFVQEVSLARIYDGVHYRNSTEVGAAMGQRLGEMAVTKFLNAPH